MKVRQLKLKAKTGASLMDADAALARRGKRSHLGSRPRADVALGRMVDAWEREWGEEVQLEEISYWRFLESGTVVADLERGCRRRAFDGGSTRPELEHILNEVEFVAWSPKSCDSFELARFSGAFKQLALLGAAAVGLVLTALKH